MSIVAVDLPASASMGRKRRFTDEDIQDIAHVVQAGQWASDEEPVNTRSAAYQRARTAIELVEAQHQISNLKTAVRPTVVQEGGQEIEKYLWFIGPRPQNERQRGSRKRSQPNAAAN